MSSIRTVCVYCASSEAVDPVHRQVAAELGRAIAAEGWGLVYGGGNIGLMGEVARAALEAGAPVTGVIPHRLADREIALESVSELLRVETMRERKAIMDERSDAFVVLPGGIGTLEELVEMITLKQLGWHHRAIVVLDSDGFWDPLLAQLRRMVDGRLAEPSLLELFHVARDVPEALAVLHAYSPPPAHAPTAKDYADELELIEDVPE
jgi:uncharacterized protein (TIGR00730 family)